MRHLLVFAVICASLSLWSADFFVSGLGNDTMGDGSSANPYFTINKAAASAAAGDTIFIAFGTYAEQLTLNKNLTLTGNGATTTIISCPPALAANVPNISTPGSPSNAVIAVLGATVTMNNLAVAGPGPTNCNSIQHGIFVGNGGTVIMNACRATSIRDNPLSGCQNGRAVAAGNSAMGQWGTALLEGCEISDYQKSGLSVEGVNSKLSANRCTITGVGPTTALAQNGILIADGPIAIIGNCTITENFFTPGPTASTGILVIGDASRISIGGLVFSGNNANIVGLPITITSFPTATPNPAKPGIEVTLVVAGQASAGELTYTWDFGDGATLGGDSVKHTWTVEGMYRAEVTLRSTGGNTIKAFIDVTVAVPPVDPTRFEALNVIKKNTRGKNPSANKDSFQVRGTFDLPKDVTTLDGALRFSIGSASVDFSIDPKGKAAKDPTKNTFKIKAKAKKGVLTTRTVQFQAKLVGNFLKVLTDLGLAPGTIGAAKVPIRMTYKNTNYGQDVDVIVKGTAKGFSGK